MEAYEASTVGTKRGLQHIFSHESAMLPVVIKPAHSPGCLHCTASPVGGKSYAFKRRASIIAAFAHRHSPVRVLGWQHQRSLLYIPELVYNSPM